MRKVFGLILIALLLGVAVVAMIETDPGYILLAYGHYTLETSLWIGLLLALLLTLLLYAVIRLLHKLFAGQVTLLNWFSNRKGHKSAQLTNRGLINFIEGNWEHSRRLLLRGSRHSETPLVNYLVAARASYQLDDQDAVRKYLSEAERSDAQAGVAVELTQAELWLQAGQYEQAVVTLERAQRNAKRHPQVLRLLQQAYLGLEDWQKLVSLLPELQRHGLLPAEELQSISRKVYMRCLQHSVERDGSAAAALRECWQSLPPSWKRDADLLRAYVALLITQDDHQSAEKTCVSSLKRQWDSELVRLFAFVHSENETKQLAQAETWLSDHPQDAQLLLCLGRLSARNQLWGKAREYFEACYELQQTPEVCAELGRLLGALGEPKVSARYFEEGLLRDVKLPELPMPQVSAYSHRLDSP